ncbi:ATP-binding domain-containing protein [Bradyrhizobium australafricanum]|uniref:ATP-binding domain-containing protein n=1 Tax=Bradyrhizobium australafricanum TaxID=2821406 RepID=UPI001CE2CE1A|nr:ATP-dependent RecD-like DNA helicase [Bradyrhizobium australafricanum]MCA6101051.1 ATP-binding domain-containing protein [Bradyrhizobium australafricanum]
MDRAEMEQGPALEISFDGESKLVPAYALPDLELAYAITCHKAQGSAFPKVIIPVVESRILDRTLIYVVALTRAKRRVVFVGDHQALSQAIQADSFSSRRDTGLGASPCRVYRPIPGTVVRKTLVRLRALGETAPFSRRALLGPLRTPARSHHHAPGHLGWSGAGLIF